MSCPRTRPLTFALDVSHGIAGGTDVVAFHTRHRAFWERDGQFVSNMTELSKYIRQSIKFIIFVSYVLDTSLKMCNKKLVIFDQV